MSTDGRDRKAEKAKREKKEALGEEDDSTRVDKSVSMFTSPAVKKPTVLDKETMLQILPKNMRGNLTDKNMTTINDALQGTDYHGLKDNFLGYASVLREGRFSISSYINAVKYISYKMMGDSNIAAYTKVFPERFQRMTDMGAEPKYITGIVAVYNKNVLVNKIFEQTIIPSHVLNADTYQNAVNHLAHLMIHSTSEKVQSDSAAKLVDVLRPPEVTKVELDIGLKTDKSIEELHNTMLELAAMQKRGIELGVQTVKQVAHSKLLLEESVVDEQ